MKLGHNSKTDLIKGVPLFSAASKQELAEIAYQPVAEAPKALERDHAERPGPEPALAQQPRLDRLDRLCAQTFEVERAANADERRRAVCRESELAQLRR